MSDQVLDDVLPVRGYVFITDTDLRGKAFDEIRIEALSIAGDEACIGYAQMADDATLANFSQILR